MRAVRPLDRVGGGIGLALLAGLSVFLLTQLERRADHAIAAPRASPCTGLRGAHLVIAFDRGGAPDCLASGWSIPEPGSGVWSLGEGAVLKLPAPRSTDDADLAFTLAAFVTPQRPVQRVTVRVGDQVLAEWRLTTADFSTLHVTLPGQLRSNGGVELRLDLPDAEAPARYVPGSSDPRRLAVKLQRVEING